MASYTQTTTISFDPVSEGSVADRFAKENRDWIMKESTRSIVFSKTVMYTFTPESVRRRCDEQGR